MLKRCLYFRIPYTVILGLRSPKEHKIRYLLILFEYGIISPPWGIATLELHERYFRKHLSIHSWSLNKILSEKNLISLGCLFL